MSFYQRSLALFFGELAGPPVVVVDARDNVSGDQVKGLRITAKDLGYTSLWFVKSRAWHVVRPGEAPARSAVPGSAVIYQVGTEVVGDLLRIAQQAYLQPGGDKTTIESYVRAYEGFLQHNIPQGLASLKAYEGVERARALLEELRREFQARLNAATATAPAPTGQIPVVAPPPAAFAAPAATDPLAAGGPGESTLETFPVPEPEPFVYDLDADLEDSLELTYDAESIAWPPVAAAPAPAAEVLETAGAQPPPVVLPDPIEVAPALPTTGAVPAFSPAPIDEPVPAPTPAPAPEPVTVVPQTTASYVFDQALVGLLGRLGTSYPWLLPDYGRHGEGMGVRVTLPAGLSVVFTHVGSSWTAYSTPEAGPAAQAVLDDDDAVLRWAVPRIREFTGSYAAQLGAVRPADAAQLFQRVADLS